MRPLDSTGGLCLRPRPELDGFELFLELCLPSALVNRGVPLAFVAEQLGHSNTRMVEKHYGHLCPSAKAEAIRTLAPVLGIGGAAAVQPLGIKKG